MKLTPRLENCWDVLSEALEDPGAENDHIRNCALDIISALQEATAKPAATEGPSALVSELAEHFQTEIDIVADAYVSVEREEIEEAFSLTLARFDAAQRGEVSCDECGELHFDGDDSYCGLCPSCADKKYSD